MTPLAQHLLDVLSFHVGARMATAAAQAAAAEAKVELDRLQAGDLRKLLEILDRHVVSLVPDKKKRDDCMRELRHVGPHFTPTPSVNALMTVALVKDDDVMRARGVIRSLARSLSFTEDRVAFVTSGVVELAAEVLKHAKRGGLVFRKLGSPPGVEVTAFSGETGGEKNSLAGVVVKADKFDVETQPHLGVTLKAVWLVATKPT